MERLKSMMTIAEVLTASFSGKEVQYLCGDSVWIKAVSMPLYDAWDGSRWRIKPEPEPVKSVPFGPEDMPTWCWVRCKNNPDKSAAWMVTEIHHYGFFVSQAGGTSYRYTWEEAAAELEYSKGRRVWRPMTKVAVC
jgi:hypothetical protein